MADSPGVGFPQTMLKAIFEVAATIILVVGTLVVAYVFYVALQAAMPDPSTPHDTLWNMLFGAPR